MAKHPIVRNFHSQTVIFTGQKISTKKISHAPYRWTLAVSIVAARNIITMKIFILTLGLLLFSFVAISQKINSISVNSGISRSNLLWNYDENDSYIDYSNFGRKVIYGFYSSVEIECIESKYFALVSGLGYYQKGGEDKLENSSFNWNLDYLTFDTKLKAKYRLKNLSPYLLVGPRVDFLIKYSSDFKELEKLTTLNKTNYGLRYGIGLQYFLKKLTFGIGWESNVNFNAIVENNGENIPKFTIDNKTMIFKCGIGFLFNKKIPNR
jgi:hypothetical protein